MPCHTAPQHTTYHTIPCLTTPHHCTTYYATPYHTIPHHTTSYHSIPPPPTTTTLPHPFTPSPTPPPPPPPPHPHLTPSPSRIAPSAPPPHPSPPHTPPFTSISTHPTPSQIGDGLGLVVERLRISDYLTNASNFINETLDSDTFQMIVKFSNFAQQAASFIPNDALKGTVTDALDLVDSVLDMAQKVPSYAAAAQRMVDKIVDGEMITNLLNDKILSPLIRFMTETALQGLSVFASGGSFLDEITGLLDDFTPDLVPGFVRDAVDLAGGTLETVVSTFRDLQSGIVSVADTVTGHVDR